MENIITLKEFTPENIVLQDPKTTKHGTKIPLKYNCPRRGLIPLVVMLPRAECPYGFSQYPQDDDVEGDKWDSVKFSLNLSCTGYKDDDQFANNPKIGMLFKKWKKMQKIVRKRIQKKAQHYIKRTVKNMDLMNELSYDIVKHSKDKETGEITDKYDPTINVKLPRYSVSKESKELYFPSEIYNHKKDKIELPNHVPTREGHSTLVGILKNTFPRGCDVKPLAQCPSVWWVSKKLSMPWHVIQVKTYPGKNQIKGYAFGDDSDAEVEEEEEKPEVVSEDGDGDEDDGEEEEKEEKEEEEEEEEVEVSEEDDDDEEDDDEDEDESD
jgi:hypothetical protein